MSTKLTRYFKVLACLLVCAVFVCAVRNHGPKDVRFHGKYLSEWLVLLSGNPGKYGEAAHAVRSVGKDGIPFLLHEIALPHSFSEKVARRWLKSKDLTAYYERDRRRALAVRGFRVLGADAEIAVQPLALALNDLEASRRAAESLAAIGPLGVDVLISSAYGTNANTVICSINALGGVGVSSEKAMNCYSNALEHARFDVNQAALYALGNVTNNAELACSIVSAHLDSKGFPKVVYSLRALIKLKCSDENIVLKMRALSHDKNTAIRGEAGEYLRSLESNGVPGNSEEE